MTLEGKTVKSITFNWHQYIDGEKAGDDYYSVIVGEQRVKSITYHEPLGTGDAHYCDIEHDDGSVTRQFNVNSIDFV